MIFGLPDYRRGFTVYGYTKGSLLSPIQDIYIYIYNLVFVPTITTDGHQKHYTLRIMGSQS